MPHRLKQLELGLPAPERDVAETSFRFSHPIGDTTEVEQANSQPAQPDTAAPPPATGDAGDRASTGANPAESGERSGSVRDRSSQQPRDRDRASHDHGGRDQASHDHGGRDRATRERRRTTGPGLPPRQDPRPAAGRPADAGQLSADDSELVASLLAAARAAEGRSGSGDYGASGLTPVIRRIADSLPGGRLAPGSEATSLKSAARLSAKLARLIARHPDRTPSELAVSICDVVRYAFAFEPESYAEGTWLVHRKLKAQGFELEARRNRWDSPECKGVWTRWRDPASDLSFEIQFHTFASWDVFVSTHDAYRTITDPATSPGERARLRARQVAGAARAQAPSGCAEIVDFAKGAR
jgi:hypothetical protein